MAGKKLLAAVAILCTTGAVASAQNDRSLHADDANRDGRVSRDEWRGRMSDFRELDRNRDGVLSGTELPGLTRRGSRDRGTLENGDIPARRGTENSAASKLDKDNSGVVEGYEWPYNADVFHQLDRDENSVLTADELRNISAATLRQLDRNRNGRLDADEWPGGYAQFERLDEDRDGKIGRNEYFQQGGEWQKRQRFDTWDRNRNGTIEADEWQAAPRLFRRLDADRDSRISWKEFIADTERYNPPYDWR